MSIIDLLNIPEKGRVNQRIYVKDFIDYISANNEDKNLIEKSISTIKLVGIINESTSGIWSYQDENYFYHEIQIFLVEIKNDFKIKQLNELFQKSFPNPIIVVYEINNQFMLSTSIKRLNKIDKSKSVVDSIQTTNYFDLDNDHIKLLNNIDYNKKNLKEFYEYFDCILSCEYVLRVTGTIPDYIDVSIKSKSILIQKLLEEKNRLVELEKTQTSMQGKMECHIKIKEINDKLNSYKY